MTLCDICAAEGCPYDEEICKGCEYNPSRQRSDDMYCKTFEWDDIIKEHETTTFEQSRRTLCFMDVYACSKCERDVYLLASYQEHVFDYNYCPYCGSPVVESEDDADVDENR
ncbi:hypothetical protein [Ruminococcus sp.]|uniref:hypothetical protein n=1 Tax=Ruminococcus sp. TaxID=41978 RepID=UPI001B5DB2FE|nr:hypothetical protein [Ruminococcus sp.]MBP5432339.1 hypothetical protein [Ruminococcus sp.]